MLQRDMDIPMMISVSHFLPSLWGIELPLNEEEMCSFLLDSGDVQSALISLADAWLHRNDDNVLLLFYENMLKDHKSAVEQIARFMDINLPSDEIECIMKQTTKEGMLKHHEVFACRTQARNAHKARGFAFDETKLVGKVRRDTGAAKMRAEGSNIDAAVGRAWKHVAAAKTGFVDYESMRQSHRS